MATGIAPSLLLDSDEEMLVTMSDVVRSMAEKR